MKSFVTASVLILAAVNAGAWPVITNSFAVNVLETKPLNVGIRQGETREIVVGLTEGTSALNLTNMTASYLYRPRSGEWLSITAAVNTNDSAVSFQWDSTRDPGYARYEGWVRVMDTNSIPVYAANLNIGMLSTPGFMPNVEGLTVEPVDFSLLTLTNTPWATPSGIASVSNALAVALSEAMSGYSNHVRTVYLRGVEVETGVWALYQGE